jgi:2-polyprenyl-3-methyl-5-hydroxy-6-metoxy-1,4-benzoquinol methylase
MSQPLMTDFDARAETWDDAGKVRRAEDVAAAMRRAVPLSRSMKALEYGAGTGLLSFCLRDALGPITLADSSAGMRAVAERKIAAAKGRDMRVIDLDLVRDPLPAERYDLIFSMMMLHHVPDVPRLLAAFHSLLNAGGWLCHADLDAEDGSFHGPEVDVHHGFERRTMRSWLAAAGFADISVGDCCAIEHGGRSYPVFLAAGRKPEVVPLSKTPG